MVKKCCNSFFHLYPIQVLQQVDDMFDCLFFHMEVVVWYFKCLIVYVVLNNNC